MQYVAQRMRLAHCIYCVHAMGDAQARVMHRGFLCQYVRRHQGGDRGGGDWETPGTELSLCLAQNLSALHRPTNLRAAYITRLSLYCNCEDIWQDLLPFQISNAQKKILPNPDNEVNFSKKICTTEVDSIRGASPPTIHVKKGEKANLSISWLLFGRIGI